LEDHSVPIASFFTYANVGANDERYGIFGISHVMEHLAFKGTSEIGTTDAAAEKKILDRMEVVFDQIREERGKPVVDEERIATLDKELRGMMEQAGKFVKANEFDTLLKREGGVGLNAGTSSDYTVYFFSLPSNKIELWAYLESSRFADPVLREFFKEKDVVMEERRMRTENQPVGKLLEEFLSVAFKDQPYRTSVIGPMSNLQNIAPRDVRQYFADNYGAGNLVIGVTGDVTPAQLKAMADKYFARLRPSPRNPRKVTVDPAQISERTVVIHEDSQPWLLVGYHCPEVRSPDMLKFNILNYLLTNGRTSRLYKKMVTDDKSSLAVGSFAGFPGSKYPGLYLLFVLPNSGHTNAELQAVVEKEIEQLKTVPVTEEEFRSAKTRLAADLVRQLSEPRGILMAMLQAEVLLGSWQKAFDDFDRLDKITIADIQDLATRYLTSTARVVGRIETRGEVQK
ncbi:MAG TPA: pitrilysin family protein, partial [Candidatus Aminicenantes bacterium]|nr:pitrilysin family protein [Candidatus Aminicenantes bacterium]